VEGRKIKINKIIKMKMKMKMKIKTKVKINIKIKCSCQMTSVTWWGGRPWA
tara:strand:+ start:674 stop:826 length:153 start_codon:yes stop_codon:yes gene_type:complete